MTEAEQEREARAEIDRVNLLREAHASRNGYHPSDVHLKGDDASVRTKRTAKIRPEPPAEPKRPAAERVSAAGEVPPLLDAASLLAELDRLFDRGTEKERAFMVAYIKARFP